MGKSKIKRIERVGLAAVNLLIAGGIIDGSLAHLLIGSGRLDDMAEMLEKATEHLIEQGHAKELDETDVTPTEEVQDEQV